MIKQVVNPISNINDDLVIPVKDLDETHEKITIENSKI